MNNLQNHTTIYRSRRAEVKKKHKYGEKMSLLILTGLLLLIFIVSNVLSPKNPITHKAHSAKNEKVLSSAHMLVSTPTLHPTIAFALKHLNNSLPSVTPSPPQTTTQPVIPANDYCLHVPVLLYHHIQPLSIAEKLGHGKLTVDSEVFDRQMSYLASSGYITISSDELVNALLNHQQLSPKSVVITLDDGYDDAYSYAFPISKKYNIVMNLMIPSGLLDNNGYMTWQQLKEMASNSLIKVYNHTWSHAALGLATRDKIESEVTTANTQLQSNLGININIFTYPYGSFSPMAILILKDHGFKAAFSTLPGTLQCESFIMTLHRIHIGNALLSSYGF